jgi:tetratricopeptide (TPR) repeat protein
MNSPENTTLQSLRKFLRSPIGRVALPLALLVIYGVARFGRSEMFGKRPPARPALSQAEAQQLEGESKALIGQQKFQEALAPTLKLYDAYPENSIYIGRLADMYDHLGRYPEEAQMWGKYLDRAPTPVQACPQYGRAYWKQGDEYEQQAIAAFERCVSIDPRNTDLIFALAHALEMSGAWDRAAQQYEQGLTISPQYTDLELGLARCRVRQDRHEEARQIAEKVLAKSPTTAFSSCWRAWPRTSTTQRTIVRPSVTRRRRKNEPCPACVLARTSGVRGVPADHLGVLPAYIHPLHLPASARG